MAHKSTLATQTADSAFVPARCDVDFAFCGQGAQFGFWYKNFGPTKPVVGADGVVPLSGNATIASEDLRALKP